MGCAPLTNLADQRLADRVDVRALRPVGDRDADASGLGVALDVVGAEVQVVPAVALHGRGSPDGLVRPRDVRGGQHVRVLGPVDEVGGGEGVQVRLLLVDPRRGGVHPVRAAVDGDVGVGVPPVDEGVARLRGRVVGHARRGRRAGRGSRECAHDQRGGDGGQQGFAGEPTSVRGHGQLQCRGRAPRHGGFATL